VTVNHPHCRQTPPRHRSSGFTLIEILVAVTVGMVLTGIAAMNTVGARASYGLSAAERAFGGLHARARSHAVERGVNVLFHVDASADSVWVTAGGDVLEGLNLQGEFGVDVAVDGSSFHVCFTPRGFANPACSSSGSAQKVVFYKGNRTRSLAVLPLGQVRYP
jgi:prepilin-type N-terminal cleavage/methylation domain-containing protein